MKLLLDGACARWCVVPLYKGRNVPPWQCHRGSATVASALDLHPSTRPYLVLVHNPTNHRRLLQKVITFFWVSCAVISLCEIVTHAVLFSSSLSHCHSFSLLSKTETSHRSFSLISSRSYCYHAPGPRPFQLYLRLQSLGV